MFSQQPVGTYVADWITLAAYDAHEEPNKEQLSVAVRPAKSRDGGLSKILREHLQRSGGGVKVHVDDAEDDGSDNEETKKRRLRREGGQR